MAAGTKLDITPALARKVQTLKNDYGLTFKEIGKRLSIAESSAHKIFHMGTPVVRPGTGPEPLYRRGTIL